MKPTVMLLTIATACAAARAYEILWTFTPPTGYVDTSPAVGDLTGDGNAEIVVATTAGTVHALDLQGRELWWQAMRGPFCIPPSIGDIAQNDGPEVLVMNRAGQIRCLSGRSGAVIWEAALPGQLAWGETALVLGDVTGDGALELVTGDQDGSVLCLNGRGEQVWVYHGAHGVTQAPVIADLNGDGKAEVLVGGDKIPLVCLSSLGEELWRIDGKMGGSPVVADLSGDGTPEILIGVNDRLKALTNAGAELWVYPLRREMDSALSVADADGDGETEIFVVDLSGHFACLTSAGKLRWMGDVEERARRSPSIGDIDGDGIPEILVAGYSGAVHVFEPDGRLKERVPLPGGSNATATLVPLGEDGIGVLVPVVNAAVHMLRWPQSVGPATALWPEYRYNAQRSGCVSGTEPYSALTLDVDFGAFHVGANLFALTVVNPEKRRLSVCLEVVRNNTDSVANSFESSEDTIEGQLAYIVPSDQAVNLTLSCAVRENGRTLARRSRSLYLTPFAQEMADLNRALATIQEALPELLDARGLEERAVFCRVRTDGLRDRVAMAGALSEEERITLRDEIAALLVEVQSLKSTAEAARVASQQGTTILVSPANPWAPFGGLDEITEGRLRLGEPLLLEAFPGETESAALNVFNLFGRPRTFRVGMENLACDGKSAAAHEVFTLHEAVDVPTEMRDLSTDALPLLNQGRLITVPAWGARQLWFNLDTSTLEPGEWSGRVSLRSLDVEPAEATTDLKALVFNATLPETQEVRLCHWGYVHTSMLKDYPDEALADQVRNGTNVFVGLFYPKAKFNERGEIVGEIDFLEHDAYVQRHAPHGMILFFNYQQALKGPGDMTSEAYAKAHVTWLRAWTARLRELGVGYDGFALYPVDEPGLRDGLVEHYLLMARLAREADPNIQLYTNPVPRISEEELREMLPYVDIWCPIRRGFILEENNAAKLDIIRSSGKTLWMYDCDGNAKHQSPLGYYRAQAWLAWQHNMTGIGFWSYCTSQDDPWFMPKLRHEYLMVYPGDGVVTSKRWEAARDGVEDYQMLVALREATNRSTQGNATTSVAEARQLLAEGVASVARFCGLEGNDTVPGADGMPGARKRADTQWQALQSARRDAARLLEKLQHP